MLEIKRIFLKRVMIVGPFLSQHVEVDGKAAVEQLPSWVGEACVGLICDPAVLCLEKDSFKISPEVLSKSLREQNPQELSQAAAIWIDEHVLECIPIWTSIGNVQLLPGDGKSLSNMHEAINVEGDFLGDELLEIKPD